MKYIKSLSEFLNESYTNRALTSTVSDDGWRTIRFDSLEEMNDLYLDRFYKDKEWITRDGDFEVYYNDFKDFDKDENEFHWHKKTAIMVDYKNFIIKTKELLSEPLYSVRDEDKGMTREQELQVRIWTGTSKKPKSRGKYLGYENGYAIIKSAWSDQIYKIDKDGNMFNIKTGEQLKGE